MDWCCQARSHWLSRCISNSVLPHGFARSQWLETSVNDESSCSLQFDSPWGNMIFSIIVNVLFSVMLRYSSSDVYKNRCCNLCCVKAFSVKMYFLLNMILCCFPFQLIQCIVNVIWKQKWSLTRCNGLYMVYRAKAFNDGWIHAPRI